jgi:hypothetical protein
VDPATGGPLSAARADQVRAVVLDALD